ncbi:MAG: hypothetical protein H0U10_15495 [Chloroflexia bacterium]|nr:hypothetical protein [Chloroflexia bacterium]
MATDAVPGARDNNERLSHRRHRIGGLAAAATVSLALLLAAPARAAGQGDTTVTVAPGRCEVEPPSAADFAALANVTPRPIATPTQPSPMGTPVATPMPAPPDVVAAVAATMAEFAACANAGESSRSLGLLSDDLLAALFGGSSSEDLATLPLTPTAAVPLADPIAEVVVEDARLLPDGRVSAITRYDGVPSRTVLVRVGDRYLIDAIDDLPAEATPVPSG